MEDALRKKDMGQGIRNLESYNFTMKRFEVSKGAELSRWAPP